MAKLVESQISGTTSKEGGCTKKFSLEANYYSKFSTINSSTKPSQTTSTETTPNKTKLPNFKRLNATERRARREKGLCFNCEEKISPCHNCKGRLFRVYETELWEVYLNCEDEEEEYEYINTREGTAIDLNALEGKFDLDTFRIRGILNSKMEFLMILVLMK